MVLAESEHVDVVVNGSDLQAHDGLARLPTAGFSAASTGPGTAVTSAASSATSENSAPVPQEPAKVGGA